MSLAPPVPPTPNAPVLDAPAWLDAALDTRVALVREVVAAAARSHEARAEVLRGAAHDLRHDLTPPSGAGALVRSSSPAVVAGYRARLSPEEVDMLLAADVWAPEGPDVGGPPRVLVQLAGPPTSLDALEARLDHPSGNVRIAALRPGGADLDQGEAASWEFPSSASQDAAATTARQALLDGLDPRRMRRRLRVERNPVVLGWAIQHLPRPLLPMDRLWATMATMQQARLDGPSLLRFQPHGQWTAVVSGGPRAILTHDIGRALLGRADLSADEQARLVAQHGPAVMSEFHHAQAPCGVLAAAAMPGLLELLRVPVADPSAPGSGMAQVPAVLVWQMARDRSVPPARIAEQLAAVLALPEGVRAGVLAHPAMATVIEAPRVVAELPAATTATLLRELPRELRLRLVAARAGSQSAGPSSAAPAPATTLHAGTSPGPQAAPAPGATRPGTARP